MPPEEIMDHAYIEQHGLIERYHQGGLPAAEEARFEDHFMGCAECQEQLALARGFRQGIRAMAVEDTARQAVVEAGLLAWLGGGRRGLRRGMWVVALLVAISPSAWLLVENRKLSSDVAGGAAVSPSVLLLSAYRSSPGEPAAVLDLGETGGRPVVLAVDAGDDPRFESFRLAIDDEAGHTVLSRDGLRPNALEVLMISFPADFFPPGDYRLRVEGATGDGPAVELNGYSFRVTAAP